MTKIFKFLSLLLFLGFLQSRDVFTQSSNESRIDSIRAALRQADPDEMANLYNMLSISLLDTEPEKSLFYSDSALSLASLQRQHSEVIRSMDSRARALLKIGNVDSAYQVLSRAKEYCNEHLDEKSYAEVLNYSGRLCNENKDYQAAIRNYNEKLGIEKQSADSTGMLSTLFKIGSAYDDWGKYDSAYLYYERAYKIAVLLDQRSYQSNSRNNLGNIHLSWGNYNKALEFYLEALDIYHDIKDSIGLSKSYNNIGIIYYDWGEIETSLTYYRLSMEVDSLMGNKFGQAQSLNNIAISYDEMGEKEKALRTYQRSLELAELTGDNYQIAITKSNIGTYYLETGDFMKAEEYYNSTLLEYQKANSIIGIAETDILLGDLYKEKRNYDKAEEYYISGLRKVKAMNLSTVIMSAYEGLMEISYQKGNYKDAYDYTHLYHRIQDSLFSVETSNQLVSLTNAYELQKREQEMEIHKVRLSEQNYRIRRQQISLFALSGAIVLFAVFTLLLIRQYRLRMRAWKQLTTQHIEILENRKKLIDAKEKAEEAEKLKSAFLVNLSHELRTPMNGIMGFTELLQKGSISAEQQKTYLSYIASSSKQLLRVLNDIIDISSIETRQMELTYEECDIDEICLDLLQIIEREKLEYKKAHIMMVFENSTKGEQEQTRIYADRKRLTQILYNLLNNALNYTDEGSISLGYKILDQKVLKFQVKDTGIGIERSKFELIFKRFRQIDESTKRQYGGSGLGLAISKELLGLMHGNITVESKVGFGSTFSIEIPYKAVNG